MKRMATMMVSGMLVLSLGLAACGQAKTEEPAAPQETAEETDEERARFERATEGLTGVGYDPVAVVATQLVSGTNYLYLCRTAPVTADAEAEATWCFVTVYENLDGEAEVTNVADFDLADLHTLDEAADPEMVGGWQVVDPGEFGSLPQDAATAFSGALEGYVGMGLTPVALLGTQVVAGTNYQILCIGTTVTAEPTNDLYVATVYEDLEGGAQLTSVEQLDVTAYV